jgi:hypothetical protein
MAAQVGRRALLRGMVALAGAAATITAAPAMATPAPADYVDGLQRMGVIIVQGRPGRWLELDPERMPARDQAEAHRLRSHWMATPERRRRIVAELEQRWSGIP